MLRVSLADGERAVQWPRDKREACRVLGFEKCLPVLVVEGELDMSICYIANINFYWDDGAG